MRPAGAAARRPLALLPTPLHPAPELGRVLGIADLWLKRDDLTGFAWGGNKVRTVGALLDEADRKGTRQLVVCGGAGSNLAAILAVAAAVRGIEVHRVLHGDPPTVEPAGLVASRLAGATITHTGVDDRDSMEPFAQRLAATLGPEAVVVPRGGATVVGAAAFADAADELRAQLRSLGLGASRIVVPVGSGGTIAGLIAGLGPQADLEVLGVAVSRDPLEQVDDIGRLAAEILARTGRPGPPAAFELVDGRASGFGLIDEAEERFAERVLRGGGLVLDRTYNLKTLRRLAEVVEERATGGSGAPGPTIHWFTGGALDTIERASGPAAQEST